MKKIDSQTQKEFERYFHPATKAGTSLPNIKTVSDGIVFLLDDGSTVTKYRAYNGKWYNDGTITEA